jgi:hypothetical protein
VRLLNESLLAHDKLNVLGSKLSTLPRLYLNAEHLRAESKLKELCDSGSGLADDSRDGGDADERPLVVGALDVTEAE